mmetsp:Transcript_19315/g.41012  ORF Transcript_19315/g.41012 Transcript_19315/m.41012 type:complete len:196 (+) Transcript_19315:126-713(+)
MSKRLRADVEMLEAMSVFKDGLGVEQPQDGSDFDRTAFTALIAGPNDSAYRGGTWRISVRLSENYPMDPPKLRFLDPIWHPNISETGKICLDTLKSKWSPALTLEYTLIAVASLLVEPNPEHGLNRDALELFRRDPGAFEDQVRRKVTCAATASAVSHEFQPKPCQASGRAQELELSEGEDGETPTWLSCLGCAS